MEERSDSTETGRQYIIELRLRIGDALVGANTAAGFLPALSGMTLQIIERGGETFLPPFDDITLAPGDRLFVAATRKEISDALASKDHPCRTNFCLWYRTLRRIAKTKPFLPNLWSRQAHAWRRAPFTRPDLPMIRAASLLAFSGRRMLRHELTENRLEAGDVLLVIGRQANIESLRDNRDTLLMEWSARELPRLKKAQPARLIFAATVLSAATGLCTDCGGFRCGSDVNGRQWCPQCAPGQSWL